MKVLHVLETSAPHTVGYTVRANAILENQRRVGIDVVAVTSPLFPTADPTIEREEHGGVLYHRTNHIPAPGTARLKLVSYYRRLMMLNRYRRAVWEVATRERVDVIHAHSSYLNAYAGAEAARRLGLPLVYEVRTLWGESAVVEDGWRANSLKHRAIWRLELGAMRRADLVVPIARGIRDELVQRGVPANKLQIVPNGVDSAKFVPAPRDMQRAERVGLSGRFIAGFIGSMRKLEGLPTLIEAYRICKERGLNLGVVIVGDGPDKPAVEAKARELGLTDVVFTGNVPHAEVAGWYSIMDVVVYPRIRAVINERVTPLKPLEVMAMGKVCIGSDVGGLTELITDDRTGLIFRSGDAGHLADVLIRLQSEPALRERLGNDAMEYVHREREWLAIVKRYQEIYEGLVRSKSGRNSRAEIDSRTA